MIEADVTEYIVHCFAPHHIYLVPLLGVGSQIWLWSTVVILLLLPSPVVIPILLVVFFKKHFGARMQYLVMVLSQPFPWQDDKNFYGVGFTFLLLRII